MFDFDRLTDTLGGLFGGAAEGAFSVEDLIATSGLEPDALQGLPVEEIISALATAGIDTSALTEGQIGELVNALRGGEPGGSA